MQRVISVFEYDTIYVGDSYGGIRFELRHFEALNQLLQQSKRAYFSCGRSFIRFSSYVGILQAADLTIEILPKIDKGALREHQWRDVLIDLLRYCKLLPLNELPVAGQGLGRHSLLNWFMELFLTEVEELIRQGLLRTYRRERSSLHVLRGRLIAGRQLQYNAGRIDRFYTDHETYDYQHIFNAILLRAVELIATFFLPQHLQERVQRLMTLFPAGISTAFQLPGWDQLHFDHRTERYRPAVQMAWILLQQTQPNLRAGRYAVAALLFDMNMLFEEFIFRRLRHTPEAQLSIYRQVRRPFWNRRHIRPDILLKKGQRQIVLDTKWKSLRKAEPPMGDLQQLYIYQHTFKAEEGVLLYPQTGKLKDQPAYPFHAGSTNLSAMRCKLLFIDLLDENGRLKIDLGRDLLDRVLE